MAVGLSKISGTIESAESVATEAIEWASDTGGTPINAGSGELVQWAELQFSVTFNASATAGAILHIRTSVDDATTENTEDVGTGVMSVAVSAGNTITQTYRVYNFDYLDVGMENLDDTYTLTWACKYVGQKLTGLS
jgi:hypothetical protein